MLMLASVTSVEWVESGLWDRESVAGEAWEFDDRPDMEVGSDDQSLVGCRDMRDLMKNGRSLVQAF
jgi:hypothetical protein